MSLTKEQKKTVRDAILLLDEERVRLNEQISEYVTRGIKLRSQVDKLEEMRNKLAPLCKDREKKPKAADDDTRC
jgi:hypothetical protein